MIHSYSHPSKDRTVNPCKSPRKNLPLVKIHISAILLGAKPPHLQWLPLPAPVPWRAKKCPTPSCPIRWRVEKNPMGLFDPTGWTLTFLTLPRCEPWCWNIETCIYWLIFGVNVGIHIPAPWFAYGTFCKASWRGSIWGFFYPQTIGIERPDHCIFGAHQNWPLHYNLVCTTVPPKEMNDRTNDIEWYCMVLHGIQWYWMILNDNEFIHIWSTPSTAPAPSTPSTPKTCQHWASLTSNASHGYRILIND